MKRSQLIAVVAILAAAIVLLLSLPATPAAAPDAAPPAGLAVPCRLSRVIDGDTVEVRCDVRLAVRLLDCWAPEADTPAGRAAKQFTDQQVQPGDQLLLFIPAASSDDLLAATTLGRALGYVYLRDDRKSLNAMIVEAGHATATRPPRPAK